MHDLLITNPRPDLAMSAPTKPKRLNKPAKSKRLGETLPIRISPAADAKIKLIATLHGFTKSDVVRMAINHGLPALESGRFPTRTA